jgi:hypothetical protein
MKNKQKNKKPMHFSYSLFQFGQLAGSSVGRLMKVRMDSLERARKSFVQMKFSLRGENLFKGTT